MISTPSPAAVVQFLSAVRDWRIGQETPAIAPKLHTPLTTAFLAWASERALRSDELALRMGHADLKRAHALLNGAVELTSEDLGRIALGFGAGAVSKIIHLADLSVG